MDHLKLLTSKSEISSVEVDGVKWFCKRMPLDGKCQWLFKMQDHSKLSADDLARLLVVSLCDEDGNLLFNEDHVRQIAESDNPYIGPLLNHLLDLNNLSGQSTEQKKTS